MKVVIAAVLIVATLGCEVDARVNSKPSAEPTTPPSHPVKYGASHWENHPNSLYRKEYWHLVCDDTGKVVFYVQRYDNEAYYLFGGNGAGYGQYFKLEPAKKRGEHIVNDPSFEGYDLHCENEPPQTTQKGR